MNNDINILHRYFIWADKMKCDFEAVLEKRSNTKNDDIESDMYMSLWYGLLYVVIEGWKSLKMSDNQIEHLLDSPNVSLLKDYRNGAFHYQKPYYNKKFEAFFKEETTPHWVHSLHEELGKWFLENLTGKMQN